MSYAEIYDGKNIIGIEHFMRDFYIVESRSGEIYWQKDAENKSRGGEIQAWIQLADTSPRIRGVLPSWQLFVNGVEQESGFHEEVNNLGSKTVELRHKECRFVFHFVIDPT
jgi:hypothetical protein